MDTSYNTLGLLLNQVSELCFLEQVYWKGTSYGVNSNPDPYVWQPYDCRYDIMNTVDRIQCLQEKNVTRFFDFGDSMIYTGRRDHSALWLPYNMEEWYGYKSTELQVEAGISAGCSKGILSGYYGHDEVSGTSYCGLGASPAADGQPFVKYIKQFAPDVVLANWSLIHRLWHLSMDEMNTFVESLAGYLDDMVASGAPVPRYRFWLSAPAMTSERQPHCVLEKGIMYSAALRQVLEPRGWVEIDWLSMTAAWGLYIPDGLHAGSVQLRMSTYLMLHHICHGEGK
ncbi:unnamed protein product [Choristocarpus tenellus]